MVDLTITISVIIALCAIVSPILVAIINNRYNIKMKKIEITKEYRLKAIENYTSSLESFYQYPVFEYRKNYESALGAALLYVSEDVRNMMTQIDRQLTRNPNSNNESFLADDINKLCSLLQKEIDI